MTSRINSITVDCARWEPLVAFWAEAVGFVEDPDNPNSPGDPEGLLISPDDKIALLFIPVPEPKTVKNRIHLDIVPTDRTRDEEVDRLLGLGATLIADHRHEDGTGWAVLTDPEDNEFCVLRSDAERAATS
jgi:hypothetical protein